MSEKTRGAIQILIKHMRASFKRAPQPKFMGEDYMGTKFYEEPRVEGRKTRGRFFEPRDKENFEQELPAEWEAWLRYRRNEPPTREEIEASYEMIITKRKNAAKLEMEYSGKKDVALNAENGEHNSNLGYPLYKEYSTSPIYAWEKKKPS